MDSFTRWKESGPQVREWLESELRDAQAVLDGYLAEAKGLGIDIEQNRTIRYWVGYVDALNNALHECAGMESEGY